MSKPRVFIMRHGETEWSSNGKHTGITDIPLTEEGESHIHAISEQLVGHKRLIDPDRLLKVYVSPRRRAKRTLEMLKLGFHGNMTFDKNSTQDLEAVVDGVRFEVTEDICEWDYGNYEGRTSEDIQRQRNHEGQAAWNLWVDGCPGGESPSQVSLRVDRLIQKIRAEDLSITSSSDLPKRYDTLIVAHSHVLRALAARWMRKDISAADSLILTTGSVGILTYEHEDLDHPCLAIGSSYLNRDSFDIGQS